MKVHNSSFQAVYFMLRESKAHKVYVNLVLDITQLNVRLIDSSKIALLISKFEFFLNGC